MIRENNKVRINELFKEMSGKKAEPGSVEQKISDLYNMGLDSVRLNAEGAKPILAEVERLLGIKDRSELTAAIAELHATTANPFFGIGVDGDLKNSDMNALYISQSGLAMGDRDYYLTPENEQIRTAYKEYLTRLFTLVGMPETKVAGAVADVMEIETTLAEAFWSNVQLRDIQAQYNPVSKADFEKKYNAINWEEYYKATGLGDFDTIIVTQQSSLAAADKILKTAPVEKIAHYLAAQYINSAASYLSDDFVNASFDFYGKTMSGKQEIEPRDGRTQRIAGRGCRRDVRSQILLGERQGPHD